MNRDPGIVRFTHCSGIEVFSLSVPEICPVCRSDLTASANLTPVRVPYPFVNASQHSCSIVIRPTKGDFLSDYTIGDDLHIGVTSSRGQVYEFDSEGTHRGSRSQQWVRSALIHHCPLDRHTKDEWDDKLETMAADNAWSMTKYDEETNNCFSFVLSFLNDLEFESGLNSSVSKMNFCDLYVSRKISAVYKYISVYRIIKDSGYFTTLQTEEF